MGSGGWSKAMDGGVYVGVVIGKGWGGWFGGMVGKGMVGGDD